MTHNFHMDDFLPVIREAGKAIMGYYKGSYTKTYKEDRSPLTEADTASHQIIMDALERIAPGTPVVSEEGKLAPHAMRKEWDYFFLIDPLDGTSEFVRNIEEFAINIALIHQNRAVMGLIHNPVSGVTYMAEKNSGAFRIGKESVRLSADDRSDTKVHVVTSRREESPEMARLLSKIPGVEIHRSGSSLKFCLVAEGKADFYPRLIPSMEWDIAAGTILVEEAGGQVYEPDGQELSYNTENLLCSPFYAMGGKFKEKVPGWKEILFPPDLKE